MMNLCIYDSWSSEDYDPEKTNYISIVTGDNWYWGINKSAQIQEVLDGLENLLHTKNKKIGEQFRSIVKISKNLKKIFN